MSTPLLTHTLAPEPEKETPMTDAIVAPAGQTVIDGNRGTSHSHDSALHLLAADHRVSAQLATDGRLNDRNHSETIKAMSDLEARNAQQFQVVLNAVKEESHRTRELMLSERNQDLRFDRLRLELGGKP